MVERKRTRNDLQNTTQKTKDRATRTSLKTGDELMCPGRISSSCARRVTPVTHPVISHECRKHREVLTTSGTYP
jgi:hypothetical protein